MNVYLGLNGHANSESLPLRFGIYITEHHQQFCTLEDAFFDNDGTNSQRHNEIDRGNKHYLGSLIIPSSIKGEISSKFPCRLVLGQPSNSNQLPPVITILRLDNNIGDITITKHISGMIKRGRITKFDLINCFHPAYLAGEIKDSNDCEEIFHKLRSSNPVKIEISGKMDELVLESADEIKRAVESFSNDNVDLLSPPTYEKLNLSDKVKYGYVMVDAYIEDVWRDSDKVRVKIINSKGHIQDLHSFKIRDHLAIHHDYTYDYLKSRIHQRGHFAVCMSPPCKGYMAESVTSIALQLMSK
jgi:hypothetical protein